MKSCVIMEWDSEFFSRKIARAIPTTVTDVSLGEIMDWCRRESVDCLYFLADSADAATPGLLSRGGFEFVDVRLTLARQLTHPARPACAPEIRIRPAAPSDLGQLRTIAGQSHRDSRFYFDRHFPNATCDALYETWIEKSCSGFADAVLVADCSGRACGYVTCHLKGEAQGQIGLIAVAGDARGTGLGRALVESAVNWCQERGASGVSVVTQGRNAAAQRLYQRCGFLTESVQLWYHRWFGP